MKIVDNNRLLFRYIFIAIAIIIAFGSLIVSHFLIKDLSKEERNKMEIWAEAIKEIASNAENTNANLIAQIITSNTTIPAILYDKETDFYTSTNIDLPAENEQEYLKKKAKNFEKKHGSIIIEVEDFDRYIYYDDSYTLKQLQLYPYVQIGVLIVFMITAFFALFTTMRMEQDKVWVGLSKETAHQLGTPISSLMAWLEYIKLKEGDHAIASEMEKDVERLQIISDRFSKIGSVSALEQKNLPEVILQTISYLEKRISKKVNIELHFPETPVYVNLSESLFSWVLENLTKNAVDAMGGQGTITYTLNDKGKTISLEVKDTGKGIPKSKFETIFNPGYTTKNRGWGLGLSLAKRIIESYHKGKIYVKSSDIGSGTTFCIELKKAK